MDKIFLKKLEVETVIGIWEWEKRLPQKVVFDLELSTDIRVAAASDSIDDALDYKKIGKSIVNLVENSSFFLVEKMAEEIALLVLKNKQIKDIKLRVEKPGALRGSKSVGVEILRSRL